MKKIADIPVAVATTTDAEPTSPNQLGVNSQLRAGPPTLVDSQREQAYSYLPEDVAKQVRTLSPAEQDDYLHLVLAEHAKGS